MKKILFCAQALCLAAAFNFAVASDTHSLPGVGKSKKTDCTSCTGNDKRCINNVCVTGSKIYTASVIISTNPLRFKCTYHYEWPDGAYSQDYSEINNLGCLL